MNQKSKTDKQNADQVVLVDEQNKVLGTMPKSEVHSENTPLHRGFSVFLFNSHKQLLLQQRSRQKVTWPLVWSNSCCGHPRIDETNLSAAKRRLKEELGLTVNNIWQVSDYRYSFSRAGIMENEICPVLVGHTDQIPEVNSKEINQIYWIDWRTYLQELFTSKWSFSEWSMEEAEILAKNKDFLNWLNNLS